MRTTVFETIRNHLTGPITVINQAAEGRTVPKSAIASAKKDTDSILKILERLKSNPITVIHQLAKGKTVSKAAIMSAKKNMDALLKILDRLESKFGK